MIENKVIENEQGQLICQSHQKTIQFIQLGAINFQQALYCQQCLDDYGYFIKLTSLEKVQKLIEKKNNDQSQLLDNLKQNNREILDKFKSDLQQLEKQIISKLDKIKSSAKEWHEKLNFLGKEKKESKLLGGLQEYFNNQTLNYESKICKEAITLNTTYYKQIFKELDDLSFYNIIEEQQTQLRQVFIVTTEKFKQQNLVKLNPTQKGPNEPFTFQVECQEHNKLITHVCVNEIQNIENSIRCTSCLTQESINVEKFSEIFNLYNETKWNKLFENKTEIIDKLNKLKQILCIKRQEYLTQTKSVLNLLDDYFIKEVNIEYSIYDGILTKEKLLEMVQEFINFQNKIASLDENQYYLRNQQYNSTIKKESDAFQFFLQQIQTQIKDVIYNNLENQKQTSLENEKIKEKTKQAIQGIMKQQFFDYENTITLKSQLTSLKEIISKTQQDLQTFKQYNTDELLNVKKSINLTQKQAENLATSKADVIALQSVKSSVEFLKLQVLDKQNSFKVEGNKQQITLPQYAPFQNKFS